MKKDYATRRGFWARQFLYNGVWEWAGSASVSFDKAVYDWLMYGTDGMRYRIIDPEGKIVWEGYR